MMLRKCIREQWWKVVLCTLLMQAHLIICVIYFEDFDREQETIRKLVPFEFLKKSIDAFMKLGFDGYVGFQHFSKAANTFGTFAAVFFAMDAVAGEVERRTMEHLLSRPISRGRILLTKYAVGAVGLMLPLLLTTPTVIPMAQWVGESIQLWPLFLQTLHSCLFLLVFYSLTFLLSTCMSQALLVGFLVLGFALIQFALLIVRGASHFSIYKLSDVNLLVEIIAKGRIDWRIEGLLVAISAALLGASLWRFKRRDF